MTSSWLDMTSSLHKVESDKWSLFVNVDSTVVVVNVEKRFFDFDSILEKTLYTECLVKFHYGHLRTFHSALWGDAVLREKYLSGSLWWLWSIKTSESWNGSNFKIGSSSISCSSSEFEMQNDIRRLSMFYLQKLRGS